MRLLLDAAAGLTKQTQTPRDGVLPAVQQPAAAARLARLGRGIADSLGVDGKKPETPSVASDPALPARKRSPTPDGKTGVGPKRSKNLREQPCIGDRKFAGDPATPEVDVGNPYELEIVKLAAMERALGVPEDLLPPSHIRSHEEFRWYAVRQNGLALAVVDPDVRKRMPG